MRGADETYIGLHSFFSGRHGGKVSVIASLTCEVSESEASSLVFLRFSEAYAPCVFQKSVRDQDLSKYRLRDLFLTTDFLSFC